MVTFLSLSVLFPKKYNFKDIGCIIYSVATFVSNQNKQKNT